MSAFGLFVSVSVLYVHIIVPYYPCGEINVIIVSKIMTSHMGTMRHVRSG